MENYRMHIYSTYPSLSEKYFGFTTSCPPSTGGAVPRNRETEEESSIGKVKKLVFTLLLILTANLLLAQQGKVFVSNNYRNTNSSAIAVKWFDENVYYPEGFNVYRRNDGQADWQKLTDQPIQVGRNEAYLQENNEQAYGMLQMIKNTDYEEFKSGFTKGIAALFAIKDPEFAEALGILFYDETAQNNLSYQYQVNRIQEGKETEVGVSELITSSEYTAKTAPHKIEISRKPGANELNWPPNTERYFAFNIYRKTGGQNDWVKITDQPQAIQEITDENGKRGYPNPLFEDRNVTDSISYEYQVTTIDYFGQESDRSAIIFAEAVDFEAPFPPINLTAKADTFKVQLSWRVQSSKDLYGFNIYRSLTSNGEWVKLNNAPLNKSSDSFSDDFGRPGGAYYWVASTDEAGNENVARIYVEVRDIIAPEPPVGLAAEIDTGLVRLTWNPSSDSDLMGYVIFRGVKKSDGNISSMILLNDVFLMESIFIDELPKNTSSEFVYAVSAVDTSFNYSMKSAVVEATLPDVTAPVKPIIKKVLSITEGLQIEWIPNVGKDLKGYDLYRSENETEFIKLNSELLETSILHFFDSNVLNGVKYGYYLVAKDEAGNRSEPSNTFSKRYLKTSGKQPLNGLSIIFQQENKCTELCWEPVNSPFIKGYIIYRGEGRSSLKPISSLQQETTFIDEINTTKGKVRYQVKAYSEQGIIAESNIEILNLDSNNFEN
ncbi:MAG: hypothetical protein AAF363_04145 [Bacteroidota bacterium]